MMWLLENKFPFNEDVFEVVARHGNLGIMKWLLENNFPHLEMTFSRAAENENLEIWNG